MEQAMYNEVVEEESLGRAGVSVKTINLLELSGITTVDELCQRSSGDLFKLDGFGYGELTEVEKALRKYERRLATPKWRLCPKCGSEPIRHEVRNHSLMWHDGDIYCLDCGSYVRMFDAG